MGAKMLENIMNERRTARKQEAHSRLKGDFLIITYALSFMTGH